MFKPIPGYEGLYSVSENGEVRREKITIINKNGRKFTARERVLKTDNVKGYLRVALSKGNKIQRYTVHRLVALVFIPNLENKAQVNHIDGNKINNCVNNLEWNTPSENEKHSIKYLMKKPIINNEKPVSQLKLDGTIITTFRSISEAGRVLNIDHRKIIEVIRGKNRRKTAGGFKWQYA